MRCSELRVTSTAVLRWDSLARGEVVCYIESCPTTTTTPTLPVLPPLPLQHYLYYYYHSNTTFVTAATTVAALLFATTAAALPVADTVIIDLNVALQHWLEALRYLGTYFYDV